MNQTHGLSSDWGKGEGAFQLEEERQKRPLEKPQEVDEACYSLEELSPDLEETGPAYFFNGNRIATDYGRSDYGQERSFSCDDCHSETIVAHLVEKKMSQSMAVDHRRNLVASKTLQAKDSDQSGTLNPRGVAGLSAFGVFSSADSLLPDFDRLLSNESETEEESSEEVRRTCQQLVNAGHSSRQIYSTLNESRFRGKLYDLEAENLDDVLVDGLDEDSSWTEEECGNIVEMMRMSAQCTDDCCRDQKCRMGRRIIFDVETDLESLTMVMSLATRRLLLAVISHCDDCDDISCTVPWCSFFTPYRELSLSVEEKRACLQSWYRRMQLTRDFEELNIDIPESAEFIQLDLDVVWPCVEHNQMHGKVAIYNRVTETMPVIPRNGIDFLVNGHFGRYGQLGLTAVSTTTFPGAVLLNIVQYFSSENSKELWKSLVGLKHENIVRHLWVCVDGNNVTVCRDLSCMDSESLESLVKKIKPPRLIADDVAIRYVAGLVSATLYLNERGIFYLRWIASGIQLNYDYTLAQLSDFSSAVNSSVIEADEEMVDIIVTSLPPYILPPEIFSSEESFGHIGVFTEVWGVGCVIYHACCGRPVHHAMRHDPPETVLQTVEEFTPRDHLKSIKSPVMLGILSKIFTNETERISLPALEKLLQELLTTNGR